MGVGTTTMIQSRLRHYIITWGKPFNGKGGGVFALEWDPANRYMIMGIYTHETVPQNLLDAINTSSKENEDRIDLDTD